MEYQTLLDNAQPVHKTGLGLILWSGVVTATIACTLVRAYGPVARLEKRRPQIGYGMELLHSGLIAGSIYLTAAMMKSLN